jgi:hypothetical protein
MVAPADAFADATCITQHGDQHYADAMSYILPKGGGADLVLCVCQAPEEFANTALILLMCRDI